jgi:hypothetical protein
MNTNGSADSTGLLSPHYPTPTELQAQRDWFRDRAEPDEPVEEPRDWEGEYLATEEARIDAEYQSAVREFEEAHEGGFPF